MMPDLYRVGDARQVGCRACVWIPRHLIKSENSFVHIWTLADNVGQVAPTTGQIFKVKNMFSYHSGKMLVNLVGWSKK